MHHNKNLLNDVAYLVDIDLSILGADSETYDWYEQAIRKEYKKVPGFIFKNKRKEILRSFLVGDFIYQTVYFQYKYEAQARLNLARAVENLS